jgi:hypothetical protein
LAFRIHKAEVLHLPATAAPVEAARHDEAKGGLVAKGNQNQRCNRLAGSKGMDQPLWQA